MRLGLLPGSRRPELENNLLLMLRCIEFLVKDPHYIDDLNIDLALVSSLENLYLEQIISDSDWKLKNSDDGTHLKQLCFHQYKINIRRNSFIEVLQSSDLLLSMAGTATEQAIGLGKPVVQIPGDGPQFTTGFAEAQRRLLGPTVFCAEGNTGEVKNLKQTAKLILEVFGLVQNDNAFNRECQLQAKNRLGVSGGVKSIANSILQLHL